MCANNNKGRYTLGDRLQQKVAATDHSVCTGPATSCSNMLRRHIAATNRFVCTAEILWKSLSLQQNFVTATSRTDSVWFDFFAACCCDKILLQGQRFSQKFSSTHEAICRCDVSQRHVAATCRLVSTDLNSRVNWYTTWLRFRVRNSVKDIFCPVKV